MEDDVEFVQLVKKLFYDGFKYHTIINSTTDNTSIMDGYQCQHPEKVLSEAEPETKGNKFRRE